MTNDLIIFVMCGAIVSIAMMYFIIGIFYSLYCNRNVSNNITLEIPEQVRVEIRTITAERENVENVDKNTENLPIAYLV
jgi:hypothetical protein